jgi:peptide-methionine (S)-S-oxide reductase
MKQKSESAVLGGGCFWCTEAVIERLRGVTAVTPGYAGGTLPHPTYEDVSSGTTGHAEVIKVEFDPATVSYSTVLDVFFGTHDPTSLNRQGADVGSEYRSIILYVSDEQKKIAEQKILELKKEGIFDNPITTEVKKLDQFYPAEDYHKDFYTKNYGAPYCQFVISPKIAHLRERYSALLK